MNENLKVPIHEKILLTIDEAAQLSNIGITKLYELTRSPTCNFVLYVGPKKGLIKRKTFEQYLLNSVEI